MSKKDFSTIGKRAVNTLTVLGLAYSALVAFVGIIDNTELIALGFFIAVIVFIISAAINYVFFNKLTIWNKINKE